MHGIAQFKLHTWMQEQTCACMHFYHMQNFNNWHVHTLLHAIVASVHGASEHLRHIRDVCHKLALGLPATHVV